MNLIDFSEKIKDFNDFIIIPHINPDGDAVGSALALCDVLRKIGKTAYVADISKSMPKNLGFIDVCGYTAPENYAPKTAFAEDCADKERMFDKTLFEACGNSFCIDHHVTNKGFADFNYIDADASATGEIVFSLAKSLDAEIGKNCAKYLYCAIASDTGSFKYSNTSEKTFEIAGSLRKIYGEFSNLSHAMFDEFTVEQLRMKQHVLESLKLYHNGKIAVMCVDYEYLENNGFAFDDADFLTSIPRSVKGVEVGIFAKIKRDEIKFSLRSSEFVNVSEIAAKFGGGGHKRAAGVSFKIPYDEAVEKLLKAIENEIR